MIGGQISVLDNGYVRLVDVMGSDLSVVNAARASYAKESEEFSQADARLLKFLMKHGHMSPFRHAFATVEVKAPIMVARQWWKYVVGSDHTMDGWNEASRRYITMDAEYYEPQWRAAPANNKQGSAGFIDDGGILSQLAGLWDHVAEQTLNAYNTAMELGVAPEQARCFLQGYALYTTWRWSASIQSIAFFLSQRIPDDAQWEIQEYALAVRDLMLPAFPITFEAFDVPVA